MLVIPVFGVSLLGLIALLSLKRWERSHDKVFLRGPRAKFDNSVVHLGEVIRTKLPVLGKDIPQWLTHHTAYHISAAFLYVLRILERRMHRVVNMIKGRGIVRRGNREASEFLKDVSEHKNGDGNGAHLKRPE